MRTDKERVKANFNWQIEYVMLYGQAGKCIYKGKPSAKAQLQVGLEPIKLAVVNLYGGEIRIYRDVNLNECKGADISSLCHHLITKNHEKTICNRIRLRV